MHMSETRGVGRPKMPEDEKLISVNLRLTPAMVEWIDRQGRERLDRPNRSTVVREALAVAMTEGDLCSRST